MNRKSAALVATTVVSALTLAGCSDSPEAAVSGLRDDVKVIAGSYTTKTRPTYRKDCKLKNRTKTVNNKTTVELHNDCKKVKTGTESYQDWTPTKWCVELDDVNGKAADDDRWFTVNRGTYELAAELAEGAKFKFVPIHHGC